MPFQYIHSQNILVTPVQNIEVTLETEYTGHFRFRTYSSLLVQNILVNPGTEHHFNPHNMSWTSHGHILQSSPQLEIAGPKVSIFKLYSNYSSFPAPAVSISDCVFSSGFPWLPISVHALATGCSTGVTSGVEHVSRITETLGRGTSRNLR